MGLVMNIIAVRVGDELPRLSKGPITRQMLVEWCAAENDYYPLHYDERVAAQMKLPGTPVQGTYRYALLGQMISRWLTQLGGGQLARIAVAYRGLDLEGDTLMARGRVAQCARIDSAESVNLDIWIENARGERSTDGTALITRAAQGR
jgi:acyl dehydratase